MKWEWVNHSVKSGWKKQLHQETTLKGTNIKPLVLFKIHI